MNDYQERFAELIAIAPQMDSLWITRDDYVVSVPDATPNYTLNLLNRNGWTAYEGQAADSAAIAKHISNGARYLFVSDYRNTLLDKPFLKSYVHNPMGGFSQLKIFRLDTVPNPYLLEQVVDTTLHLLCDAEQVDPVQPDRLLTSNGEHTCVGGSYTDSVKQFSGSKSMVLYDAQPYGFTTTLSVSGDERVLVRVKRLSGNGVGAIVVSNASGFYLTERVGVPIAGSEWEEVSLLVSGANLNDNSLLTLYAWNNSPEKAYFDDFEVVVERIDFRISANR
jgi:hypothetical protein